MSISMDSRQQKIVEYQYVIYGDVIIDRMIGIIKFVRISCRGRNLLS